MNEYWKKKDEKRNVRREREVYRLPEQHLGVTHL